MARVNKRGRGAFIRRHYSIIAALTLAALAVALYAAGAAHNPPGFYLDESSIAYNAHTVSQAGRDEYGVAWPLFFRAFGEYKNPVYIYLLAAVFRLTGPSVLAARMLSVMLGAAAALLLGHLAEKVAGRKIVGILVAVSALLTPWLYGNSRLVFEAALYPLAVVLFLLALQRASAKATWSALDVLRLASTLALLTYSYSIGRLLAPLLALGLVFFATRGRRLNVLLAWLAYGLTLVPLFVFQWRHPGALTSRFGLITYINGRSNTGDVIREFFTHYAADINPWRLLVTGEYNIRDHIQGAGCLLAVTFFLSVAGLVFVLKHYRSDPWWRFMLYALAVSVVPASLTANVFPQIRLVAFPVLLHVFTIPAWLWLLGRDKDADSEVKTDTLSVRGRKRFGGIPHGRFAALAFLVILILAQGAYFQWLFHRRAPERGYVFDEKFPQKVLAVALSTGRRPVYLYDPPGKSGYVQAYWHALLAGADASRFVRLTDDSRPPPGSAVISTEEECENCRLLARHINFIVYTPLPSDLRTPVAPLPDEAFRAEVTPSSDIPATLKAGERKTIGVLVRNVSGAAWPSVGEDDGRYAITLRDRWRKEDGTVVNNDDGRQAVFYGLDPGDAAGINLIVNAPDTPGAYVLEADVVQEGVAWFGDRGSEPYRKEVVVTP